MCLSLPFVSPSVCLYVLSIFFFLYIHSSYLDPSSSSSVCFYYNFSSYDSFLFFPRICFFYCFLITHSCPSHAISSLFFRIHSFLFFLHLFSLHSFVFTHSCSSYISSPFILSYSLILVLPTSLLPSFFLVPCPSAYPSSARGGGGQDMLDRTQTQQHPHSLSLLSDFSLLVYSIFLSMFTTSHLSCFWFCFPGYIFLLCHIIRSLPSFQSIHVHQPLQKDTHII